MKGPVPDDDEAIPFGQAEIKRRGGDVTVVATSLMVQRSLAVAERLAAEGIQVEVVDPRTIVPLDFAAILASVEKTGRVVVVDECHQSCGVAAELAGAHRRGGIRQAQGAVRRVTTSDVPVPFSAPLEEVVGPSEARIADAIRASAALRRRHDSAFDGRHGTGCGQCSEFRPHAGDVQMYRVAIDVGGTFTDCLVLDADGRLSQFKALNTPGDPAEGFSTAWKRRHRRRG